MSSRGSSDVVVLGGCGAMGRVAVRDLFAFAEGRRILVADLNESAARDFAASFHSPRVRAAYADATRPRDLAGRLRGAAGVINCTQHDFNLRVMAAARQARAHYVDLGGLFTWTRRQLQLHDAFRRAGLTAVLGAGCSPGITNVMARHAVELLGGRVDALRIRVGAVDLRPRAAGFTFAYSAQTIVEELTLRPWVLAAGRLRQVAPRGRWERVRFPPPVGTIWTVCTRHSELATLPSAYRRRGLRTCDFKVGFAPAFVRELVRRLRAGATVRDFQRLAPSRRQPDDYEMARVVARRGRRTVTVDFHARARPEWQAAAGDLDTGCPPSIVAQMILRGDIAARGVWAPEAVIAPGPFFEALVQRGMWVVAQVR